MTILFQIIFNLIFILFAVRTFIYLRFRAATKVNHDLANYFRSLDANLFDRDIKYSSIELKIIDKELDRLLGLHRKYENWSPAYFIYRQINIWDFKTLLDLWENELKNNNEI